MFNFFKKKQPSENSPLDQIFNEMGDYSVLFQDGTVYFRENHRLTATVYVSDGTLWEAKTAL